MSPDEPPAPGRAEGDTEDRDTAADADRAATPEVAPEPEVAAASELPAPPRAPSALAVWARRPAVRAGLAALAVVVWLSVWFFRAKDDRGPLARFDADAPYYYAYVVSLFYDRDLDFRDEYVSTGNWYRFGPAPTGRPKNVFGIGPAVFEAPFFLVGHAIARLRGLAPDGFSQPEVQASAYASMVCSLAAVAFALRLCRRRAGRAWWAGPVLAFFGTPVIFYALRQPGYAHPFATLAAAWFVDHWDAGFTADRRRPRALATWVAAGALAGLMALARPQLAPWALLLACSAWDDRRHGATWPGLAARGLVCALAALAVFSPQLFAWKAIFGSYYLVPQGQWFMRWDAPAWSEVVFSSRNGLFAWTPLCALAAIGLVVGVRRHPRLAGGLLLGCAAQVVANGAVWDWWGGGSYGGRRFDSCYVAFAFGLCVLIEAAAVSATRRPLARRAMAALRAAIVVSCVLLTLANLTMAGRTVVPPSNGGEPAFVKLRERMPKGLGAVTEWFSYWSTAPARILFRLRYGTSSWGYDRITGVYFLGESYPGLNSFRPATEETVVLSEPRPYMLGFVFDQGLARVAGRRARLLMPINRRHGPLDLRVSIVGPAAGGDVILRWNGAEVARKRVGAGAVAEVTGEVQKLRRGVNVLEIGAPSGTGVPRLWLGARPGAPP